jgi:hypothetical protein
MNVLVPSEHGDAISVGGHVVQIFRPPESPSQQHKEPSSDWLRLLSCLDDMQQPCRPWSPTPPGDGSRPAG